LKSAAEKVGQALRLARVPLDPPSASTGKPRAGRRGAGCQPAADWQSAQSRPTSPAPSPTAKPGGAALQNPLAKFSPAGQQTIAQGARPGEAAQAVEPRQGRKRALTPLAGLFRDAARSHGSSHGLLSVAPNGAWTGSGPELCKRLLKACVGYRARRKSRLSTLESMRHANAERIAHPAWRGPSGLLGRESSRPFLTRAAIRARRKSRLDSRLSRPDGLRHKSAHFHSPGLAPTPQPLPL
jgi:hypothetical protein